MGSGHGYTVDRRQAAVAVERGSDGAVDRYCAMERVLRDDAAGAAGQRRSSASSQARLPRGGYARNVSMPRAAAPARRFGSTAASGIIRQARG